MEFYNRVVLFQTVVILSEHERLSRQFGTHRQTRETLRYGDKPAAIVAQVQDHIVDTCKLTKCALEALVRGAQKPSEKHIAYLAPT